MTDQTRDRFAEVDAAIEATDRHLAGIAQANAALATKITNLENDDLA